jgi:hypothetical protein
MYNPAKPLRRILPPLTTRKAGGFSISFEGNDLAFAQKMDKNKLQKENLEKNIQNTYDEILGLERETRKLAQSVSRGPVANLPSVPSSRCSTSYSR